MTPDERWLAALWPFVRSWLPAAPAGVVEIGCGPLGGFVPMLRSAGYNATGVDPEAPQGPWYHQVEFERYEPPSGAAHAVVACTSLHHVAEYQCRADSQHARRRQQSWCHRHEARTSWYTHRTDMADHPVRQRNRRQKTKEGREANAVSQSGIHYSGW